MLSMRNILPVICLLQLGPSRAFLLHRRGTSTNDSIVSLCGGNCTTKPNLPCSFSIIACPPEITEMPLEAAPGPPEDLQVTLYYTQERTGTHVSISWRASQGPVHPEGFYLTQAETSHYANDNTANDVCFHYQISSDAQWTPEDNLTRFFYDCEEYVTAAFLIQVTSDSRSPSDLRHQQALVYTRNPYYNGYTSTPCCWFAQLVIHNDSCSQQVHVSFLQEPDGHKYNVYLVEDPSKVSCPGCSATVYQNHDNDMAEVVFNRVLLGKHYFVQVIQVGAVCGNCHCGFPHPGGCHMTQSGSFFMPENDSSCYVPTTPVPTTAVTKVEPPDDDVGDDGMIMLASIIVGIVLLVAIAALFIVVWRRIRRPKPTSSGHAGKVVIFYDKNYQDVADQFKKILSQVIHHEIELLKNPSDTQPQLSLQTEQDELYNWVMQTLINYKHDEDNTTKIIVLCTEGSLLRKVHKDSLDTLPGIVNNAPCVISSLLTVLQKQEEDTNTIPVLHFAILSAQDRLGLYVPGFNNWAISYVKHYMLPKEFPELVDAITDECVDNRTREKIHNTQSTQWKKLQKAVKHSDSSHGCELSQLGIRELDGLTLPPISLPGDYYVIPPDSETVATSQLVQNLTDGSFAGDNHSANNQLFASHSTASTTIEEANRATTEQTFVKATVHAADTPREQSLSAQTNIITNPLHYQTVDAPPPILEVLLRGQGHRPNSLSSFTDQLLPDDIGIIPPDIETDSLTTEMGEEQIRTINAQYDSNV